MKKLKNEFEQVLSNVGNDFKERRLTALFPLQGDKYKQELMIVGRAINKWGGDEKNNIWKRGKKVAPKTIRSIISYSGKYYGECAMKWIIDHWKNDSKGNKGKSGYYRMNKSAFWRVTKKVLSELAITKSETDWSSYLVWTDLYKIASPDGGNPSNKLCNAQFENCVSMLKSEIECFRPRRILFLTGYEWFKDFENIGFKKKYKKLGMVEWVGSFGNSNVVVAKHPQGKNETKFVDQVISSFSK